MSIEWLRDLVIIIFGLVSIVFLIFFSVLFFSLYRKARTIQDSVLTLVDRVEGVVGTVEAACGLLKPLIQVGAVVLGILQGISSASKIFKGKGSKGSKKNG